ncbi:MAG TPA: M36 family metallopeptidase [Candidatus Polarisedimenticolaceae bacterium]
MRRVLGIVCLAVGASAAYAVTDPHDHGAQDPRIRPLRPPVTSTESSSEGEREFVRDRRTGRMVMVQGRGIPIVPGRGNTLDARALAGLPLRDGEVGIETLAPLVESFLLENAALVGPVRGRLELDPKASVSSADGRLHTLQYRWSIDGVPVEGAYAFVRINSGNITQFGAPFVGDSAVSTRPAIEGEAARRILARWSGDEEVARFRGQPALVIQLEDDGREGIAHRLVWIVEYKVPGRVETWQGRVDARTGEVVAFRDVNQYGRVTGGVYPRTVVDQEIRVPFPFTSVQAPAAVVADAAGSFTYAGGSASSALGGRWFDVNCVDGCTNPASPLVASSVGTGRLDFGLGGADAVGNGFSTRADRNAFFHLNQVRRLGKKWLPSLGWLDTTIVTNVNILSTCNAFWDGSANFYRSGGGCNNTGEISDVMQHEWGHGLDGNTLGGDGATGEATADAVAVHMTQTSAIGPWFRTNGSPVRELDKTKSSKGLMTRTNVGTKCGAGTGAQGFQVHCEGEIYGQTTWDLSQALVAKHGYHTGWRTSERIFFTSLPNASSYLPSGPSPVYDAYLQADDDDGNLVNGTPNATEIYQAFNAHEIAGTQRPASTPCARPAQPALTATPSCSTIALSWAPVAGAVRYEVLRNEILENAPFFPVATVNAPTTAYTDVHVAPGTDYGYVVMAVTSSGCESPINLRTPARLTPQPILTAVSAVADDLPRGNRSGFPDPGEEVDLRVAFGNFGEIPSGNPSATLVPVTPGVTVLNATDFWPSLEPGAAADNTGILRFSTASAQVACGDAVRFRLDPTDGSGCVPETSYLEVVMGTRETIRRDAFEVASGWTRDAASSTATAGGWTLGDPDPTAWQPGDDVSEDGTFCWFTAPNAGGEGTDDVDGGVTTLLSPVIDLTGRTGARLSFWRWFANRDLGEDSGDFFRVEVSSNGGSSWVTVENLDTNQSATAWTRREFRIEDFVALTSQFRIRFQVADGTATGNLIEAAVDEVRIERPTCDATPACYTAPTFAGLASATPGASCAEVALSWSAASTNCQNAAIRYNVYRSTDPAFVPSAANRIATGLAGTTFQDSLLAPGASYHYLVRADDSRSGEDANLVRRTVVAPSAPDLVPPGFAGLSGVSSGTACGETVLTWSAASETCSVPVSYEVYRSTDPGFVPSPATRVASTFATTFTDAALAPGASYTYVVRARDGLGNEDANLVRFTGGARVLDKPLISEAFEGGPAGWTASAPNDAVTGRWEWGDPAPTGAQPGDDTTADPGVNAWVTGLAAGAGDGDFDVDTGTTTLLSSRYDLTGAVDPVVRYARWFTNDRGGNPGEDPFDVDVSNNDGASWVRLEQVGAGTPLAWVVPDLPLAGVSTPSALMRFRFTARDGGVGGSLVEAAIDDFRIVDRNQGCGGCASPSTVGTILVSRVGSDVVLDWTADPVAGTRFVVYRLGGPALEEAVRIGTTQTRTFVHPGAASAPESFYYRVSAVNACGVEGALE